MIFEIGDLMLEQERFTNKENIDRIYGILELDSFLLSLKSPAVRGLNVNLNRNANN